MLNVMFARQAASVFNNCSLGYFGSQNPSVPSVPAAQQGTCQPAPLLLQGGPGDADKMCRDN